MHMHYLTYVFIPSKGDITKAVAKAMEPFSENLKGKPWKRHLDADEIAVMAEHLGIRRSAYRRLAERMEDWNGGRGGMDDRGLYAIETFNRKATFDWYTIGGRWRGQGKRVVVGAGTLSRSSSLAALLPHDFLTPDGKWHRREWYVRTGWLNGRLARKSDHRWLAEFKLALTSYPRHRVVWVDRHA